MCVYPDDSTRNKALQTNVPSGAWGIDRIDQSGLPLDRTFYYPDTAGEGVDIYVIGLFCPSLSLALSAPF
jgi:hypothetical protein